MNKKGFTLVELLAVVVILGIILALSFPSIVNFITNTTKNAFKMDAKMVLNTIRLKMAGDLTFDYTTINESNIETLLNIDSANYKTITIKDENGDPFIIIVGKNKWNNMTVIGTRNNIEIYEGLVLLLDASIYASYPGSGNTWYDLSGNNNNCQWDVAPDFNLDNYFVFNGTSHYGTITNNPSLDFSENQTLIMVLRYTYTTGRKNPWDQAYGGYGTWTHENGSNINQYFGNAGVNNTPYIGINSGTTTRGVWNIIAITRSPVQHRWYINGVHKNSTVNPYGILAYTAANIQIGRGYAGYWEGDMGYVIAYNRALSATEIEYNFNTLRSRFGL